jgi:hypothetical protein
MSTNSKPNRVRRALMAGVFVATGALTIGTAMMPAQAQYYSYQYNNPYYSTSPYQYGYQSHYNWWRWHRYWEYRHQYYR